MATFLSFSTALLGLMFIRRTHPTVRDRFARLLPWQPLSRNFRVRIELKNIILPLVILGGQASLIAIGIARATTDVLASPWSALEKKYLVPCRYPLLLFLYQYRTEQHRFARFLPRQPDVRRTQHADFYPLGYGYDLFIHRARGAYRRFDRLAENTVLSRSYAWSRSPALSLICLSR